MVRGTHRSDGDEPLFRNAIALSSISRFRNMSKKLLAGAGGIDVSEPVFGVPQAAVEIKSVRSSGSYKPSLVPRSQAIGSGAIRSSGLAIAPMEIQMRIIRNIRIVRKLLPDN